LVNREFEGLFGRVQVDLIVRFGPCGVADGDFGDTRDICLVVCGPSLVGDPASLVRENGLIFECVEMGKFRIVSKSPSAIINLVQVLIEP